MKQCFWLLNECHKQGLSAVSVIIIIIIMGMLVDFANTFFFSLKVSQRSCVVLCYC